MCWRIAGADGVDRFIRTVGTPDRAEVILGQQISSRLGAEIGNMQLDDLISIASSQQVEERMDRLNQRLLGNGRPLRESPSGESLKETARKTYGIDLVDIRLRRFNYPPQVRDAIFDRIRSERQKKAADYQSEGAQLAEDIKSQAEYESADDPRRRPRCRAEAERRGRCEG